MKKGKLLLLSALLALATPVLAQDEGVYLGGSLGYAQYKDTCKRIIIPCDDHDTAWRLFGGYQLNRHWAAELGYADLGAVTAEGTHVTQGTGTFRRTVAAWDLSAVATFPFAGNLAALFKAGIYRARSAQDQVSTGFPTSHEAGTNSGLSYGAGLEYTLWKIGLRAEWQRYENVGGHSTPEDDIDVYSIAALWRF